MKYNRLLPLLTPLITLIFLEIFYKNPKLIYVVLVLINLSIFFTLRQFCKAGEIEKNWRDFYILPGLMSAAVVFYSILLSSKAVIQLLFALFIVLLYLYLRHAYYYLVRPIAYEPFSIENISSYGNFLTFFLFASAIYGLQSFLNTPVWILMLFMLLIVLLVIYQIVWANKINVKKAAYYILLTGLILIELFWSISFLPLNYNAAGLILAICYYVIIGLLRHYLLDKLDKNKVKLYLAVGTISLVAILFTSRWM